MRQLHCSWAETGLTLIRLSCCSWSEKNFFWFNFLVLGKNSIHFFFLFPANMLVAMQLGKHPSTYFILGIFHISFYLFLIIYAIMMLEKIFVHMFK